MTSTLARCAVLTAAGTTSANFFAVIDGFFRSAVPEVFTVDTVNSNAMNLYLEHPQGWALHIDDNGTLIRCRIAPSGDFDDPETSPFASVIVSTTTGTTMHFAEYDDAILVGVKDASVQSWRQALHAGKIYSPFNASDPALGLDGFGILGGIPNPSSSTSSNVEGSWFNTTTPFLSTFIRAGFDKWADRISMLFSYVPASGTIAGNVRLTPYPSAFPAGTPSYSATSGPVANGVTASSGANSGSSHFGYLKYIREYPTLRAHRTTIPAVGSDDDQTWLVFCEANSTTRRQTCLWSKAVTP